MKKLNAAQILRHFIWDDKNQLPKSVFSISMEGGAEINQDVLLEFLMKFQNFIYNHQEEVSK